MQGLLDQVERTTQTLVNADEIRLAQIRLAFIYDALAAKAAATRTCPGPYWRRRPEVQEAIQGLNGKAKTKRRRFDLTQVECTKYGAAGGDFVRCYIGPPRTHEVDKDDTRRILCENCGQLLKRDRKNKVVNAPPPMPIKSEDF